MALGDLRRGLADRAKAARDAAGHAVDRVRDRPDTGPVEDTEPVEDTGPTEVVDPAEVAGEDKADAAEVRVEVARLRELIAAARPAPGPVTEPWAFGFGGALAAHPSVPKRVRGLVGRLDRFGGLRIAPEGLRVDGEDMEWSKVLRIRRRNLVEYLLSDAVDNQLDALPIPPFPGRSRVVSSLSQAVLTLLIAHAEDALTDHGMTLRVPAEIVHKGGRLNRVRELGPGAFATIVLADPAVSACLLATADEHGVVVEDAEDDLLADAAERAAAIRAKISALQEKLSRLRR